MARALRESASNPACLPASASAPLLLSDSPPPKQITDALPDLAAAASAGEQRRALRLLIPALSQGRTVLRRTLRSFTLPDGLQLLVFVQLGGGINLRDPAACAKARREHAARLAKGRSAETLAAAQRRLAQLHDTAPGLQTLSVLAHIRGQASTGGTGLPVGPGQPLHPGLVLSAGAGKGRDLYVGIAGPHTTRLVATTRSTMRRVPSRVPVHHGFYALILPRGTGPVRLREITASGTTARVVQVR
ncbi:MAG TPA: hypothetical protein VMT10_13595 [Solirubrobacteraceae bacterium]|nr:hypothetical protein [Solirubrobacteraceae bacterium]